MNSWVFFCSRLFIGSCPKGSRYQREASARAPAPSVELHVTHWLFRTPQVSQSKPCLVVVEPLAPARTGPSSPQALPRRFHTHARTPAQKVSPLSDDLHDDQHGRHGDAGQTWDQLHGHCRWWWFDFFVFLWNDTVRTMPVLLATVAKHERLRQHGKGPLCVNRS